jgi:hypothetical protein
MADSETIVKLKIDSDNSGAKSSQKELGKVGDAAERANARAAKSAGVLSAAYGGLSRAVSAAGRAVGTFTKALGLIGLAIQAVQLVIGAFQKLKDWLDRDRKAAEELARKMQDAKNKAAIEASAAAYEKLNGKLSETLRMERERDSLADRKLSQERAAEDAQSELDMQQELAGLDRNDPEYQQKADLVRSKYARMRAGRTAERARQDRITAQQRLTAQAEEKDAAADELEKDVYGKSGDAVLSLKRQIATEKNPERKAGLEKQLDDLVAQQKKKLAEIKKLRDEAKSLQKEAVSLFGAERAAQITAKAANVAQDAADADTRRQMDANRQAREDAERKAAEKSAAALAKKNADEGTVSEGKAALAGLKASAVSERARAQAAADAYAKEAGDVRNAQNAYDMVVANGGSRKERSAALAALQKEQREAEDAKHEMERVAAQVAGTLRGINEQIKALARAVSQAEGRLAQNQADAPEG